MSTVTHIYTAAMEKPIPPLCDHYLGCKAPMTKGYFQNFCLSPIWRNCYHYGQWKGSLKTCIEHLAETAVLTDRVLKNKSLRRNL